MNCIQTGCWCYNVGDEPDGPSFRLQLKKKKKKDRRPAGASAQEKVCSGAGQAFLCVRRPEKAAQGIHLVGPVKNNVL